MRRGAMASHPALDYGGSPSIRFLACAGRSSPGRKPRSRRQRCGNIARLSNTISYTDLSTKDRLCVLQGIRGVADIALAATPRMLRPSLGNTSPAT